MDRQLVAHYDRFIDWPARLARELPPLLAWLGDARDVADVACGTGRHAVAVAETGRRVTGFDLSAEMLAQAVQHPAVTYHRAAFGQLRATGAGPFDAAYCLGNAWSNLTAEAELTAALADLAAVLRPGGKLLLHVRNMAGMIARGERFMPLVHRHDELGETLFQRLVRDRGDGLVELEFLTFHRPPGGDWSRTGEVSLMRPWTAAELTAALADWTAVTCAGDWSGAAYGPDSVDLFVTAIRPG